MEFKKYQHIERLGTTEVDGIEVGKCYVFPKIDGTNSSVWMRDGVVCGGSRNRELTLDKDNAGFYAAIKDDHRIKAYLDKHPTHRLFGEWLVPHSLKTYRDDAWRRFYVFDVCVDNDSEVGLEYIPYDIYQPLLEEFNIDYLAPLKVVINGGADNFLKILEQNNFLIKDGCGCGEGIVIKNYEFFNRYGRQTWAKIVTSEFREKHHKAMGAPVQTVALVEQEIVDKYVTAAFVEKEYAKIVNDNAGWQSRYIPQLLSRVYHELICEEMWNILKEFRNPKIDFKALNNLSIAKVKTVKPDIFG
jgi:hypothetical protein